MYINTRIVKALMALRHIPIDTLGLTTGISVPALSDWLLRDDSDDRIPFEHQLDVLRILGINGETPRNDMVHFWRIRETLFSRFENDYAALQTVLLAFGKAEVVYFSRESDPHFSLECKTYFGLQFRTFRALLEITSNPLREIRFTPDRLENAEWMNGQVGILLSDRDFTQLQIPGELRPKEFDGSVSTGMEAVRWDGLNQLARQAQVSPEQIASWLAAQAGQQAAITAERSQRPAAEHSLFGQPMQTMAAPPQAAPAQPQPTSQPTSPPVMPPPMPQAVPASATPSDTAYRAGPPRPEPGPTVEVLPEALPAPADNVNIQIQLGPAGGDTTSLFIQQQRTPVPVR